MSERIRAAIRLLYPDDMTPNAKRVLESILAEEAAEPQWHVFDKDDESTWPHPSELMPEMRGKARGQYWTVHEIDGQRVVDMEYWYTRPRNAPDEMWANSVTHWRPVVVPLPPESDSQ